MYKHNAINTKRVIFLATLVLVFNTPLWAEKAKPVDVVTQCKLLVTEDFSSILDAPTQIMSVGVVEKKGLPDFCHIKAYVTPQVGFELLLPIVDWNGKFIQMGNGGSGGSIYTEWCLDKISRGYACAQSDTGHKSTSFDRKWAYNNLYAEVDFGFRAVNVTTIASKAIIGQFYKQKPKKSYFMGCSTGGRQAMVEAQSFPWDYDGIISGAPNIDAGLAMDLSWSLLAIYGDSQQPILSHADVKLVHKAAVTHCDMDDELKDGIIGNPPACQFDPLVLSCKAGLKKQCLSKEKLTAVQKLYSGPTTSQGIKIYPGGTLPGGEMLWSQWWLSRDGKITPFYQYMSDIFRYSTFLVDPGPSWKLTDLDFDRVYKRLGTMARLNSASNPDLRRFKVAGGKLIAYSGWNDALAKTLVNYYEVVEQTMGGREPTQEFFRLFMVPGMDHCSGGVGAHKIDYLGYLERWVEKQQAPDWLLAKHPKGESSDAKFARPIYPYPNYAVYKGTGDSNDASNFKSTSLK